MQLQNFWNGLTPSSRRTLSTTVGGPLVKKTPEGIVAILDELSEDANQWPAESNDRKKLIGIHQVDSNILVQAQLDTMAKEIRKIVLAKIQSEPQVACDFCGMGHPTHESQASAEVVNVIGSFDRGNYQSGNNFNSKGLRHPGTLLPDTERNPKETVNAVSLRSGHVLEDPRAKQKDELIERHVEILEEPKNDNIQEGAGVVDDGLKKKGKTRAQKKKKDENAINEETEESKYMPALPFPQKQRREKLDKQFERFLEVLKKEIFSKKRKVEATSVVKLTRKLEGEIGEIRSMHVSLQLADQTTIIPEGIVEDVLVRVEIFVFHVDFIVVNMDENMEVPLIIERSFLAMGREILDIQERRLTLRMREERVIFKMEGARGP
ncbi:uncharacterized protein [Nicotiana tomentosiformis]|uniref:uncharacterized protein n=1 Tax=Nicotiana tomentosiformis TaxID=4098 RepID=UPI00388C7E2A